MSNLRNLKKDVAFLAKDIITSTFIQNHIGALDDDKAAQLIVKAQAFQNASIKLINNPKIDANKADKAAYAKAVKTAYSKMRADFFEQYSAMASELCGQ